MKYSVPAWITVILLFFSCEEQRHTESSPPTANHTLLAVCWYQNSAEMQALYYQAYNTAKWRLRKFLGQYPDSATSCAVVLDIDETVLNNSPLQAQLIVDNQQYTRDKWNEWVNMEQAHPLPGALDFVEYADSMNVEVFYISNRNIELLEPTINNLKKYRFPNADSAHIILRAGDRSKKSRRKQVKEKYTIVLLIGDNLEDFSEIFEHRSNDLGFSVVDEHSAQFGRKFIVLPNPMYGSWEYALYKKRVNPESKTEKLKKSLKPLKQ